MSDLSSYLSSLPSVTRRTYSQTRTTSTVTTAAPPVQAPTQSYRRAPPRVTTIRVPPRPLTTAPPARPVSPPRPASPPRTASPQRPASPTRALSPPRPASPRATARSPRAPSPTRALSPQRTARSPAKHSCCVCLEEHISESGLLACKHAVCSECVGQLQQPVCPICRAPLAGRFVSKEQVDAIQNRKDREAADQIRIENNRDELARQITLAWVTQYAGSDPAEISKIVVDTLSTINYDDLIKPDVATEAAATLTAALISQNPGASEDDIFTMISSIVSL